MRKKVFVFIDDTSGQFVDMPEHKMWEEHKPPCIYLESPFQGPETGFVTTSPGPPSLEAAAAAGRSPAVTEANSSTFSFPWGAGGNAETERRRMEGTDVRVHTSAGTGAGGRQCEGRGRGTSLRSCNRPEAWNAGNARRRGRRTLHGWKATGSQRARGGRCT